MIDTKCHCVKLRRAAHALTRLYDQSLENTGLSLTQFSLLRTISRLDQPYISTLADALGLERSTLGRNIRLLEKAGLVEFGTGRDARTRVIRLSNAGVQTVSGAIAQWEEAQSSLESRLGGDKLALLESLLAEVTD